MCKLICKWPEQGNGSSFANGRSGVMAAHLRMAGREYCQLIFGSAERGSWQLFRFG